MDEQKNNNHHLFCPISGDWLEDPVFLPCCGRHQAVSRQQILYWLNRSNTCPFCRRNLCYINVCNLPRCIDLSNMVEKAKNQQNPQQNQQQNPQQNQPGSKLFNTRYIARRISIIALGCFSVAGLISFGAVFGCVGGGVIGCICGAIGGYEGGKHFGITGIVSGFIIGASLGLAIGAPLGAIIGVIMGTQLFYHYVLPALYSLI